MAPVAVFTSEACLRHDAGEDHPETPERLRALHARLAASPVARLVEAAPAPPEALLAVHPAGHLATLEEFAAKGGGLFFMDTVMNAHSWTAAVAAAGAVLEAVEHAHAGRGHAFAAVRPPGHHALAAKAMGFCFLNNVMIGARRAQRLGRQRVLVVDWDVHHGNGTQALMEHDPSIRFVSLHQSPWYPGTGAAEERGVGNVFNVPRPGGLPADLYVGDLWAAIAQATDGWRPDLVLVSAGFDAMAGDPLGRFTLEPAHYAALTEKLRAHLRDVPLVGVLEGGYDPARLAEGAHAHIAALA
ncbi:MAG: histone deacetylase [Gemmatimonadales bacterium]|nr:histone deacetylase [Gemmatimonadales bacterium]